MITHNDNCVLVHYGANIGIKGYQFHRYSNNIHKESLDYNSKRSHFQVSIIL